ncbi:hypothetical protein ACQP25_44505 (plasmid) [Microtetraspora malaysiensis]|uniref:phage tail tube protein n=1 Tax=Microtetraspora malaysiensis TaxID=161358 RepID=UPI003D8B32B1
MGAENIFVAGVAWIYLAPVGTAAPDGVDGVPMPTAWKNVGMFSPESLNWKTDPKFEDIKAHQAKKSVRKIQTDDSADLEADLLEWSLESFRAVFGGGSIEEITPTGGVGSKYYKFVPPDLGAREEVAVCVEIKDGTRMLRRIIPRAMQTAGVEQKLDKTNASTLPLRMSVLGNEIGADSYDLLGIGFASAFAPPASGGGGG